MALAPSQQIQKRQQHSHPTKAETKEKEEKRFEFKSQRNCDFIDMPYITMIGKRHYIAIKSSQDTKKKKKLRPNQKNKKLRNLLHLSTSGAGRGSRRRKHG